MQSRNLTAAFGPWFSLVICAVVLVFPVRGSTVAYWRFEEGPADAMLVHPVGDGVFYPAVADSSGNGNALSVWSQASWANYVYRTNVPAELIPLSHEPNHFSVQNTGGYPCMWTESLSMRTMAPGAFSIEVSFKPETGGYRTLVGRDSAATVASDPNLSALYLQIVPGDAVAIGFCDVSGYWHQATSATGIISGYTYPDSSAGHWYHMAAVSDGKLLSLYLDSGAGFCLVAQTDMQTSGSPNTAMTAGLGSGSDWTAGNWSVGRGLYSGGQVDRAYGFIDEVRISDSALSTNAFLFAATAPPLLRSPVILTNGLFQLSLYGTVGWSYVIQAKTNLASGNWQSLRTNPAPFTFTDSDSRRYPQRFYRAVLWH